MVCCQLMCSGRLKREDAGSLVQVVVAWVLVLMMDWELEAGLGKKRGCA